MKHLLMVILTAISSHAAAYDFSPKSPAQTTKQAQRWTLSQWMEQKGKIQWMDLWLHSNKASPSFYEMYLGGEHSTYDRTNLSTLGPLLADDEFSSTSAHFGLFITWFGIYGKYENSSAEDRTVWEALAQLRLLGTSDQASNFTVFYGLKNQEFSNDQVLNQQFGGALTLYLLSPWAVQARYQHLMAETSDLGNSIDGYRFEATTWLEWGAARVYGTWFHEPTVTSNALGSINTRREGISLGLRFYLDFKK